MANDAHFCAVLLDHLDNCPVCGCPRITFGVGGCPGVCECECHDRRRDDPFRKFVERVAEYSNDGWLAREARALLTPGRKPTDAKGVPSHGH